MDVALTGPGHVRIIGLSAATGAKLGYSLALVVLLLTLRLAVRWVVQRLLSGRRHAGARFWARQGTNLAAGVVLIAGLLSIWFDQPSRLVTGLGLFSAGLAFALQQVFTSLAGYLLILRGDIFTIGDRVVMGGVRGDVIALGFIRTTILEMGKPSGVSDNAAPDIWVHARQYTGRIVTVANSTVFADPVFNYSRDFPYLWEEMSVPVPYAADRERAEAILLAAAHKFGIDLSRIGSAELERMRRRYFMPPTDLEPAVFHRLTDNWLELTVRFIVPSYGIRKVKSDMSREILARFDEAGIAIASGTYDIVGLPPLRLHVDPPAAYPADERAGSADARTEPTDRRPRSAAGRPADPTADRESG